MMIMPANNSSGLVHWLAGKYPGSIGWLQGPGKNCLKEPRKWLPYALDNGKFMAFQDGRQWDESSFFKMLDRCQLWKFKPIWTLVPDEVGNRVKTLRLWELYAPVIARYGWPLAFAVQDGMTVQDVPENADVVFIGGTTEWKWKHAATFCAAFPRVHIGRVNSGDRLESAEAMGAESVDGTGFFRDGLDSARGMQLQNFIAGHRRHECEPMLP